MINYKKIVADYLREVADRIDGGNSNITEDEAMDIFHNIAHEALSKEQAASFLHISKSRFDTLIREGKLPKGNKRRGFKELMWYKDTLEAYRSKLEYSKKR